MNKIEKMLKELCPDGIEWKKLGEVCNYIRGKGLKKEDIVENGSIPIILYGELYTIYGHYINDIKSYTIQDNISSNYVRVKYDDILLPISSTTKEAQIGKASVYQCEYNS